MRTETVNNSYKIKKTQFEKIKKTLSEAMEKTFQLIMVIVFIYVGLSFFVYFLYRGTKYLYTFAESEITEYYQKKEDAMNEKIEIEARLAFRTFKEQGLVGLVELSKSRYTFLEKNRGSLEDLYRIATIDIVGEKLDEVFLDRLSAIAEEKTGEDSALAITTALKSEYFRKNLTNNRIVKIRNFISDKKTPDTETMRFVIQKVFDKVASEQLGNDNQLTNTTAKNIIKTTVFFSHNFIDSFGLAGFQRFSQMCYRELEQSNVISLQQVEKCFVVDVYGGIFSIINKLSRTTATEYFAVESVGNRPSAFFNKLGISEGEAKEYLQAWIHEIRIQSIKYNKKDDEF